MQEASIRDKKLWRMESLIHLLNNIALNLNLASLETGQMGARVSRISNEVRKFVFLLERDILLKLKFEDAAIEDVQDKMEELGEMFRLLAINSLLEAKRINNMKVYLLADDMRKIAESIANILEASNYRKNLTMINPDRSFKEPLPFIVAKIGDFYWAENMNSVIEIIKPTKENLVSYPEGSSKMKHQLVINNSKIPVVNLHVEMDEAIEIGELTRVIVLNLGHIMYGHTSSDLFFGLLVDDIEYAGFLQKGIHELSIEGNISQSLVKYCWKAQEAQILFYNWDNIINEHEIRDYRKIETKK